MSIDKTKIETTYDLIKQCYLKYLKDKGVKLPSLNLNSQQYTINALVLIYLAQDYPHTRVISKSELTKFIQEYYPDITDVQQARHLGMQSGWYIISGRRGENPELNIPKDSYRLITLEQPHPSFVMNRKIGFNEKDFEELKKRYDYRCAVCGSKEGSSHFFRKNVIVKLEKGHMNPKDPLVNGNIIPQCQVCNRPDKNKWIYDVTGRVIEVADTEYGMKIVENFIKKISKEKLKRLSKFILLREKEVKD